MKNFYIGKVIMFQTDICLVLDQMIEGGTKRKQIQNMENAARAT